MSCYNTSMIHLLTLTLLSALYYCVSVTVKVNVNSKYISLVKSFKLTLLKFCKISKQEIVQKWSTEYMANIATYL